MRKGALIKVVARNKTNEPLNVRMNFYSEILVEDFLMTSNIARKIQKYNLGKVFIISSIIHHCIIDT